MKNYCIRYTKDGNYTAHDFNNIKELKEILSGLKGIIVEWKFECNAKSMCQICIEHNEKVSN